MAKYIGLDINRAGDLYESVHRCANRKTCCNIAVWDVDGKLLCNSCKVDVVG